MEINKGNILFCIKEKDETGFYEVTDISLDSIGLTWLHLVGLIDKTKSDSVPLYLALENYVLVSKDSANILFGGKNEKK